MKFKSLIFLLVIAPLSFAFSPQKVEAAPQNESRFVERMAGEYLITNNSKQTIRFRLSNNTLYLLRPGKTASYRNMSRQEDLMVYTYSDGRWHMLGKKAYELENIPFLSMERSIMTSEDNTISFRIQ